MYINIPKTKKFDCLGRGNLTFFSKAVNYIEVRGDLSSTVENKESFTSRPSVENNATTLIWYLKNRLDGLINRFTILKSTQD